MSLFISPPPTRVGVEIGPAMKRYFQISFLFSNGNFPKELNKMMKGDFTKTKQYKGD